jgi:hypothetical protein
MLIREVAELNSGPDTKKLAALSQFLLGRSEDESATKQISQQAFIDAAKSLGVNVNSANLGDLISQEPLSNILEPLDPNSGVVKFKGNTEAETGMSVDQARAVVDSNAKAAMKRRQ